MAGCCWMKKCMGKKEVKLPVVDLVERKSIGPSYAGVERRVIFKLGFL
jgi:hypothetical protein